MKRYIAGAQPHYAADGLNALRSGCEVPVEVRKSSDVFHGCVTTRISDVQRQRCVCLEPRYRHYSQHYSYRLRQVIYE
jgi:hypothetical protein